MKKLKKRGGFSLTETLIAVALLAIVSAAGATVSGVVISVRNGMIQTADSQVLASTILETLADEVRFGQGIKVDATGKIVSIDSMTFGSGAEFSVADGKIIATVTVKEEDPSGSGNLVDKQITYDLLTESAYSHLKVASLEMAYDTTTTDGTVEIKLEIRNNSTKVLWSGSLAVVPLNGVTVTA